VSKLPIPFSFPVNFALIVASPDWSNAVNDTISYNRVSSEKQAGSGLGLEAQRQRIAAYCQMKGLHLLRQHVLSQRCSTKGASSRSA
jgi:hypothetical protein